MKSKIKSGDEVVVISGAHKGNRGKVLQMITESERLLVEGVNMRKRAVRRSEEKPDGGIEEREGSLHVSNVMLAERYDSKPNRKNNS